jgi:hypothetical protein
VKARRFNLRGCEVASRKIHQGRSQLSVDLSRLGGSQWEAQEFDLTNSRRCELREALTFKPSPRLHVVRALTRKGAIPVSPDRVSQD